MSLLERAYKFFNFFINFDNRGYKVADFAKVFVMFLGFLIAGIIAGSLNAPLAVTATLLVIGFVNLISFAIGALFYTNDKSSHNFKYQKYKSTDVVTNDAEYKPVYKQEPQKNDNDNEQHPRKRQKSR